MPNLEDSHFSFKLKKLNSSMHGKIMLSVLVGILVVGVSQFAFAEELEETTYIAVDKEEFQQPKSKYNYQEITIIGHLKDYARGDSVTITIVYPDKSEEEINTYASKKGDIYTLMHITNDSQIGIHSLVLDYRGDIAKTSFEILEVQ